MPGTSRKVREKGKELLGCTNTHTQELALSQNSSVGTWALGVLQGSMVLGVLH